MLKPGIYRHRHEIDYVERSVYAGDIVLEVKETNVSFILRLLVQNARYDAPQIDDMFQKSPRVVIRKDGSKHALRVWDDHSFTIYPYRVGVPYYFIREDGNQK